MLGKKRLVLALTTPVLPLLAAMGHSAPASSAELPSDAPTMAWMQTVSEQSAGCQLTFLLYGLPTRMPTSDRPWTWEWDTVADLRCPQAIDARTLRLDVGTVTGAAWLGGGCGAGSGDIPYQPNELLVSCGVYAGPPGDQNLPPAAESEVNVHRYGTFASVPDGCARFWGGVECGWNVESVLTPGSVRPMTHLPTCTRGAIPPRPGYPEPTHCGAPHGGETVTCTSRGTASVTSETGQFSWTVATQGTCVDEDGLQIPVVLGGGGSSANLGVCSGERTLRSLSLDVSVDASQDSNDPSDSNPAFMANEELVIGTSTYPVATPFQIVHDGRSVGSGVLDTRLVANCPPAGTSAAVVSWSQQF